MKRRKHNLTPEQLEEIALSDQVCLINATPEQIIQTFLKEFNIIRGDIKIKAKELYDEFNGWSENRRIEEVPTLTKFGLIMIDYFDRFKATRWNGYKINKPIEQIRVEREKKERNEAKQAKKEAKQSKKET